MSGLYMGGGLMYYTENALGVGLRWDLFGSKALFVGNKVVNQIIMVGPAFSYRIQSANKRNFVYWNSTLGYINYNLKINVMSRGSIRGNGGTVGLNSDFGLDIGLTDNIFLVFQTAYLMGSMQQLKVRDWRRKETIKLEDNQRESLHRLDFSVGLCYRFRGL